MGDGGREMFGDAGLGGGDGDLGGGDTALGDGDAAIGGRDGDLEGGDGVVGDGDVGGWRFLPIFPKKESFFRKWWRNRYYRGTRTLYCVCVFLLTLKMINNYKLYYNLGF